MAKKNETLVLVSSLAVTIALIGGAIAFLPWQQLLSLDAPTQSQSPDPDNNPPAPTTDMAERISFGEDLLLPTEVSAREKQEATEAIAAQNYPVAVTQLEAALAKEANDPEALIYLNNARIGTNNAYAIAVSVPIGVEVNAAKEILRGVAQAQNEINTAGGINGVPLKVAIANDDNHEETASQLAATLADNPDILGVVGHFGSSVTLAASPVYQERGLVAISPTSTSVALATAGDYIFRTVPSDRFAGNALARYQINGLNRQRAAVFFNGESTYSRSLKNEFTTALFSDGGEVVAEYDFSQSGFNPVAAVDDAIARGAEVLMLAPNSATLDQALQIVQVNESRLPLLGGDSTYKPKTLQLGRRDAVGMVVAVPWHSLANPKADFTRKAARLWGGEVNWRTAMAYDATRALIAALKIDPSRDGIRAALTSSQFNTQGATSKIRFLPSGDRNQEVQLVRIEVGSRSGFGYDFVPLP